MKIITLEEINNRIVTKYPNQPFTIIDYSRVSKPFTIKCGNCERERQYSSFNNYINSNRKHLCDCYNNKSNYNLHQTSLTSVQQILDSSTNCTFIEYWYKYETKKNMIKVKCNKCTQEYSKPIAEFIKSANCPFCVGKELLNTRAVKSLLGDGYELLDEYKGSQGKITIRHNCGFVWKTSFKSFNRAKGCPKCDKKRSKGERAIASYLIENNISFETEKSFEWQSNQQRRYDFFIPKYNLICEYNGEQHYLETKYFKTPLNEQQKIDKIKQHEALAQGFNYLIIPYYEFQFIPAILTNWFNDYSERKQG